MLDFFEKIQKIGMIAMESCGDGRSGGVARRNRLIPSASQTPWTRESQPTDAEWSQKSKNIFFQKNIFHFFLKILFLKNHFFLKFVIFDLRSESCVSYWGHVGGSGELWSAGIGSVHPETLTKVPNKLRKPLGKAIRGVWSIEKVLNLAEESLQYEYIGSTE